MERWTINKVYKAISDLDYHKDLNEDYNDDSSED